MCMSMSSKLAETMLIERTGASQAMYALILKKGAKYDSYDTI